MYAGISRFALLTLLGVAAFRVSANTIECGKEGKPARVLVLNSRHETFPGNKLIGDITGSPFVLTHRADLTFFKLDISNFRDFNDWLPAYDLIRRQIRAGTYNLIITTDDGTLDFLLLQTDDLKAGNVPIVATGYEKDTDGLKLIYPDLVAISQETNVRSMVEIGARLFGPGARAVIVVDDTPEGDVQLKKARDALADYRGIDIEYIDGSHYASSLDVFRKLNAYPPETFAIFVSWCMLEADTYSSRMAFFLDLNHHVGLPYMCSTDIIEAPGCIGGNISATRMHVDAAIVLAERILHGESPREMQNQKGPLSLVFDYERLKSYGLDPKLLPPNAEIINRPRPFGGVSPQTVYGVGAVILLLFVSFWTSFLLYLKNRREKRRNDTILRLLPVQIMACDRSGNFLYKHLGNASEKLCALFGQARNVFDDDSDEAARAFQKEIIERSWREGRLENVQFRHGGEIFSCSYVRADKTVFGAEAVLWISIDITELETLRREARAKADEYRRDLSIMSHIANAVKVSFFTMNLKEPGVQHFVVRTSDWPQKDGVPVVLDALPIPEDVPPLLHEMNLLRKRKKMEVDFEFCSNLNGRTQYFDLFLFPSADGSNEVSGCLKDISEHKKNELLLDYSARLKKLVFDLISVAFMAKDMTEGGKFLEVNDYFCTYTKMCREEIIGRVFTELPVKLDIEAINEQDRRIMQDGGVSENLGSFCDREGVVHHFKSHKVICTNPENNHKILLGILLDVGELQEKQSRLEFAMKAAEEAARVKSMFLATMSHEIRTPLNAVIGFSELMQFPGLTPEELSNYAGCINLAGNTLLRLINDILDLSKLEADQMQITPVRCDIRALLQEMFSIFGGMTSAKNLDFTLECPDDIPWLFLDDLRLRQVLLNLIGNACKFTADGFVRVEARFEKLDSESGTLTICVRDSGAGIADDNLLRVFEPFWQETRSMLSKDAQPGTGIGLAISKRLVERMGGTLSVESKLDCGSVFTVRIRKVPFATGPRDDQPQSEARGDSERPVFRRKALLVDDIPVNLRVLQALLGKLNVECVSTTSPLEAIKIAREERLDVVLADLWMPEMNGGQLAEQIHAIPALEHLPIFMLTADVEAKDNFNSKRFAGVVLKPVTLESLKELLQELDRL